MGGWGWVKVYFGLVGVGGHFLWVRVGVGECFILGRWGWVGVSGGGHSF